MSLHDAMRSRNRDQVSKLIQEGCDVNAENQSGLTVIQYAAMKYSSDIAKVGSLTEAAQELRIQWRQTIEALLTKPVKITKVTKEAWRSSALSTMLDVWVDAMLYHFGFQESEIRQERGYQCYF